MTQRSKWMLTIRFERLSRDKDSPEATKKKRTKFSVGARAVVGQISQVSADKDSFDHREVGVSVGGARARHVTLK
ncbi:hypothetical protein MTO96_014143 [Rhipicephalus appendiculatus]